MKGRKKGRGLFAAGAFVFALMVLVISIGALWNMGWIDFPAVVVHEVGHIGAGRVAGTMDVQLSTKFHRQEHSLSCEVATLKMALQTVGLNVPESELIAGLPFDKTPKGGGVWGNPNKGFVGNIDGKMLRDGYGVYWDPIAKLGLRYKRTEVLRKAKVSDIAEHVAAGRPVIVWGNYGRATKYSWLDSKGVNIPAVNGEHTRIVTGFSGPVSKPTSFSLIDPLYGYMEWSAKQLENNWNTLGRNGVVVYPHPKWVREQGSAIVWEISKDGIRHRIPSWGTLILRGGAGEYIVEVTASELNRYDVGADIEG